MKINSKSSNYQSKRLTIAIPAHLILNIPKNHIGANHICIFFGDGRDNTLIFLYIFIQTFYTYYIGFRRIIVNIHFIYQLILVYFLHIFQQSNLPNTISTI